MAAWILPLIGCACSMSYCLVQELTLGHKFFATSYRLLPIAAMYLLVQWPGWSQCWCSDLVGHRVLSLSLVPCALKFYRDPNKFASSSRSLISALHRAISIVQVLTAFWMLLQVYIRSQFDIYICHFFYNTPHAPNFSLPICWAPCPTDRQSCCSKAVFTRKQVSYVLICR